jgi:hypothetical protein
MAAPTAAVLMAAAKETIQVEKYEELKRAKALRNAIGNSSFNDVPKHFSAIPVTDQEIHQFLGSLGYGIGLGKYPRVTVPFLGTATKSRKNRRNNRNNRKNSRKNYRKN